MITPEDSRSAIFGSAASEGVAELLAKAKSRTITSAYAEIPAPGRSSINPGERHLRPSG